MAHARLWQFQLVHFWLEPKMFFCVEYEEVIDNALFAISFSSSEDNQILAELRRTLTIPSARRLSFNLYLVPAELD